MFIVGFRIVRRRYCRNFLIDRIMRLSLMLLEIMVGFVLACWIILPK